MTQKEKIAAYLQRQLSKEDEEDFIQEFKNNPELANHIRVAKAELIMLAIAEGEMATIQPPASPYKKVAIASITVLIVGLGLLFWWVQMRTPNASPINSNENKTTDVIRVETGRRIFLDSNGDQIEAIIYREGYKIGDSIVLGDSLIEVLRRYAPGQFPIQNHSDQDIIHPSGPIYKVRPQSTDFAQAPFEKTKPIFPIDRSGLSEGHYGAGGDLELAKQAWMQDSMQKVLTLTEDVPASSAKYLRGLALLRLGFADQAEPLFYSILSSKYERYSEDWWGKDDVEWFYVLARLQAGTGDKSELEKIFSNNFHKYKVEADMLYKKMK